ncbi:MAG: sigma-70 family RNA polymerase sigma factor [Opitutae bacterium]|nr:sigma-70 family RNA polymerase sigma factor [Opitutae bacterium]
MTTTLQVAASALTPQQQKSASAAEHDRELVRRFNAGDESAFTEIILRHRGKIHALALGILHNQGDAEEITQDTFIRAYRGLARFRGDSSLATWLYRIAVNLARNRYWYFFRRRRHTTFSLDCPLSDDTRATFADVVAVESHDPARSAVTDEFSQLIASCLEQLDERHREILTLRNFLHLSYEEIATSLGINVGTVKSRIARARERLRAQLAANCPEFAPDAAGTDYLLPTRSAWNPACASA